MLVWTDEMTVFRGDCISPATAGKRVALTRQELIAAWSSESSRRWEKQSLAQGERSLLILRNSYVQSDGPLRGWSS